MKKQFGTFACLLIAFSGMTACGGGSGGGTGSTTEPPATTVTFTFTGAQPKAVAARFGTGAFAPVSVSGRSVTLTIPKGAGTYTVAYVCPPDPVTVGGVQIAQIVQQFVFQANASDTTSYSGVCADPDQTGQTALLTGSVDASAVPGAKSVEIWMQNGTSQAVAYVGAAAGSFSLAAPAGNSRVLAVAYDQTLAGFPPGMEAVAARSFSDQPVPGTLNGGSVVVLGPADQTTSQPITYNNVQAGFQAPTTNVGFSDGVGGALLADGAADHYPGMPASAVKAGDSYYFIATARNGTQSLVAHAVASTAGPLAFTFRRRGTMPDLCPPLSPPSIFPIRVRSLVPPPAWNGRVRRIRVISIQHLCCRMRWRGLGISACPISLDWQGLWRLLVPARPWPGPWSWVRARGRLRGLTLRR
jgi:hypothetical protein